MMTPELADDPTDGPADHLAAFLSRQRWFGGKGRDWRVAASRTLAWLQRDLPAVRVELVTVRYAGGEEETYQVPLAHLAEPADALAEMLVGFDEHTLGRPTWVYDALHVPEATRCWVELLADEAQRSSAAEGVEDVEGVLRFSLDPNAGALPRGAVGYVHGGEQSNTSVVYADVAILKVIRQPAVEAATSPTAGINPDIELHSALARAGSTHIANPLGSVHAAWTLPPGERVAGSLAMLQEYLRNATDGWKLALASVRDLFGESDLHADEVGGDFAGEAYRLGLATAEVHLDLARTLPTEQAGPERLAVIAAGMRASLERAAVEVPALAPYVEELQAAYDAVAQLRPPVLVQRVHGDLHLGQVLRTPDGWKMIDFEGEPATPLARRRQLDSPLRDVAGMLRSFDYAARHLLAGEAGLESDPTRARQLEYRAVEWAQRNREAFCEGYEKGSGSDPRGELLRAYETDKAVYEVGYETRNRPSWVRIPLAAIERLAADPGHPGRG